MRQLLPTDQYERLSRADIFYTLRTKLDSFIDPGQDTNPYIQCADVRYRGPKSRWVVEFINADISISAGPRPGNPETFDCDDYAFHLKTQLAQYAYTNNLAHPLAVGCLLTPLHALNVCIEKRGVMRLIDTHSTAKTVASNKSEMENLINQFGSSIELIYF